MFNLKELGECYCNLRNDVNQLLKGPTVTREPEYEHYNYWAEDSGGSSANAYIWSWGNGDVGIIGMPVGDGVEITAVAFHADNGGTNDTIQIRIVDIQVATAPVILHTMNVIDVAQGQNDNTHIYQDLRSAPVTVPDGAVLAFQSGTESGAYSSTRCGMWTRQETGRQIVTNVS